MATTAEFASGIGATEPASLAASIDVSQLTDAEILNLPETRQTSGGSTEPARRGDTQPDAPAAGDAQPAESADGEKPAAPEAAKPAEQVPHDGRQIPAKYREILKANPELRDAWFRDRAYQEVFPTVAEARTVRQMLPGGAEDLKTILAQNQEHAEIDELYYGGTPEGHARLVEQLVHDDPRAFSQLLPVALSKWAQTDPSGYNRVFENLLGQTLVQGRLPDDLAAIREHLRAGDTAAAQRLLGNVEGWVSSFLLGRASGRPEGPQAWRESLLERRQRELDQREAALQQEQHDQRERFEREFTTEASQKYVAEVEAFLKPKLPAEISQKARERMVGDIVNEINRLLAQSRSFTSEIARVKNSRDTDRAVNFFVTRAKQFLPQVATKILSEWTGEILAANRRTISDKRSAASKVDIGAGATPGSSSSRCPLTPRDIDYHRMSDRNILDLES